MLRYLIQAYRNAVARRYLREALRHDRLYYDTGDWSYHRMAEGLREQAIRTGATFR
jgi:hypothetical protein